ncbi:hypothetical protein CHU95_04430 [Niveispirillum lacus]|uniref:Uncharacterized protein n=2 Tax=Niveispirillum lacus TaxID=1981099 RepID=A0A255Z4U5_9PROT|nr:hypothetical protein CHU95_04430 [Niveispirillum lacus]
MVWIVLLLATTPAHAADPRAAEIMEAFEKLCIEPKMGQAGDLDESRYTIRAAQALVPHLMPEKASIFKNFRIVIANNTNANMFVFEDERRNCVIQVQEADEADIQDAFASILAAFRARDQVQEIDSVQQTIPRAGRLLTAKMWMFGTQKGQMTLGIITSPTQVGHFQHHLNFGPAE